VSARPAADAAPGDAETIRVPLLDALLSELDDERRHVLIELGPLRSGNLQALQGLRCRLDVLDLAARLPLPDSGEDWPALIEHWVESWPPQAGEKARLVLCWNLLNYLEAPQIKRLFSALAPRLAPDARVHALIESAARTMSLRPTPVALSSRRSVTAEPAGPEQRSAPRHSSGLLESAMSGFKAERTVMLGNGQREYLFHRDPGPHESVTPTSTNNKEGKCT